MGLLKHLQRETSTGYFVPEIDGLRFFAILPVVLFHFSGIYGNHASAAFRNQDLGFLDGMFRRGDFGVRLFFTISGFILGTLFLRNLKRTGKTLDLKSYVMRRITRLEPPYVINLIVVAALLMVGNHEQLSHIVPHLLASVFYVHNLVYARMSDINYVAWTLEVEVQFYILAPLLAQIYRIPDKKLRYSIFVVGSGLLMLLGGLYKGDDWRYLLSILPFAHLFLTGMFIADVTYDYRESPAQSKLLDIGALGSLILLFSVDYQRGVILPIAGTWIACGILMVAALHGYFFTKIVRNTFIVTVGGMCYTIYLWHSPIISGLTKVFERMPSSMASVPMRLAMTAVAVMFVLAISAVLYAILERPFMNRNWPKKVGMFLTGKSAEKAA